MVAAASLGAFGLCLKGLNFIQADTAIDPGKEVQVSVLCIGKPVSISVTLGQLDETNLAGGSVDSQPSVVSGSMCPAT